MRGPRCSPHRAAPESPSRTAGGRTAGTHLCNHSTWEAEVGGSWCQPGLHGKALFQNRQKVMVARVGRKGPNSGKGILG